MNPQAPVHAADDHWLTVMRLRFRAWRGNRPFWAGLFTLLGGVPIIYFPFADIRLANVTLAMATTSGSVSLILGGLLITLGIGLWFQQGIRVFAGVAAILLALVSIPKSNLGGFFIGFLTAMVGGCLALAWAPGVPAEDEPEQTEATEVPPADPFYGVPGPRDTETAYATETTGYADGGRNSAG
ncbi:DUF6114 domain-containing protein [Streptomyces sp. C]|uniref:DUF6114 domain-containing protein n=1 Tax=Streptomyces sp. C TaxID=253839 RepID=UPI0001DEF462|nr:DUF6114 domain-containing protein [Streptomyces sp. C]EFL17713.1 integral membrane protein [Streptomyces sp. C]